MYAAGLVACAVLGAGLALGGAALFGGIGTSTTTIREVVPVASEPTPAVASSSRHALTVNQIYRRAAPGVVQVTATQVVNTPSVDPFFGTPFPQTQQAKALGSGFVIDKAGYIVTNYHVVAGAQSVHVSFSNNDSMKAEIIGKDPATDVALLKVQASSRALKPLLLGNSDGVHVGDQVAAIGNPLGLDRSITLGIVSALHRSLTSPEGTPIDRVIQTDAALNHGNSGGPLLNAQGQVVGVSSAVSTGDSGETNTGIGFAIPINTVRDVVAELKAQGHVDHLYLGVVTRPVTATVARISNLPVQKGLLVESVAAGSGADRAGLRGGTDQVVVEGESYQFGGDVITKADGMSVSSTEDLREIVSEHKPGESLSVEFYRGAEPLKAEIKLGRQSPLP
jgi:S1-C subfamily serine protease